MMIGYGDVALKSGRIMQARELNELTDSVVEVLAEKDLSYEEAQVVLKRTVVKIGTEAFLKKTKNDVCYADNAPVSESEKKQHNKEKYITEHVFIEQMFAARDSINRCDSRAAIALGLSVISLLVCCIAIAVYLIM